MNNGYTASGRSAEELLAELLKVQKKTYRRAGITAFAHILLIVTLLAVLAAGVLLAPRILGIVDQAETALDSVQTLVDSAEEAVGAVGSLANDNAQDLAEAVDKLNGIDFDGLNEAIRKNTAHIKTGADRNAVRVCSVFFQDFCFRITCVKGRSRHVSVFSMAENRAAGMNPAFS